jgi:hypothetical protein
MIPENNIMPTAQEKLDDIARMEASISTVSEQLGALIRITEKNDTERKAEIRDLWTAMKEQNALHSQSLEKQGEKFAAAQNKGELTWGKLLTAGGFVLSLATATVIVSNSFVSKGFEQVAIHDRYSLSDRNDIRRDIEETSNQRDHESQVLREAQRALIERIREEVDINSVIIRDNDKEIIAHEAKAEERFQWLRDDVEAIKEDLQNHIKLTQKLTP